ncbi:MAG TPA: HdeA/HdeB family chaperone [Xanthobacteraceae bacterium]
MIATDKAAWNACPDLPPFSTRSMTRTGGKRTSTGKYYLEEVVVVGAWLSGYYNAKQNNTVIDSKKFEENTAKVMQHCRTNPQETVMHAIEALAK